MAKKAMTSSTSKASKRAMIDKKAKGSKKISRSTSVDVALKDSILKRTAGLFLGNTNDDSKGTAVVSKKAKQKLKKVSPQMKSTGKKILKIKKTSLEEASSAGTSKYPVPLEEGDEEDEAVSREVLLQASSFLTKLAPGSRKQFWNLRNVALGKVEGGAGKKKAEVKDSVLEKRLKAGDNDEEEVDNVSDVSSEPSWISENDDTESEGDEEEDDSEMESAEEVDANAKNGRKGGSLFARDDGMWDD